MHIIDWGKARYPYTASCCNHVPGKDFYFHLPFSVYLSFFFVSFKTSICISLSFFTLITLSHLFQCLKVLFFFYSEGYKLVISYEQKIMSFVIFSAIITRSVLRFFFEISLASLPAKLISEFVVISQHLKTFKNSNPFLIVRS